MYDLILRDATLVTSAGRQVADVAIADGKIAYVGPRPPKGARHEMSAMGKFLIPGVIDTAVQFDPNGDPDIWERESRAAVTGGVTTVLALPMGDVPVIDRASARRRRDRATGRSWSNFGLWGACRQDNVEELAAAIAEGLLVGALAYVGDDQPLSVPLEVVPRFFGSPRVLAVQAGANADAAAVVDALREIDRPVHFVHLSTAAELALLDPVRGDLPVTAGVTPHHLFLSAEELRSPIRTSPPVRPEHDRRTLWSAIKRGRLDCVASDHHPSTQDETGVPGTELLLPLMLSAVRYGRLSLEMLVALTSEAPARIFGLEKKGRIAKGYDADLVLFAEGEVSRVETDKLVSGAGWSPYLDRETAPKPELVMVNGKTVAGRGKILGEGPFGQAVAVG